MLGRRPEGGETRGRLKDWIRTPASAEALAGHLLCLEGFKNVKLVHLRGGRDGGIDVECQKDGEKWICAVYFPRGEIPDGKIRRKFLKDLKAVKAHKPNGFIFFTNQELQESQKKALTSEARKITKEIGVITVEFRTLEWIAFQLDSPKCYGIRLEFLNIEMEKDEQIAFWESMKEEFKDELMEKLEELKKQIQKLHKDAPRDDGETIETYIDNYKRQVTDEWRKTWLEEKKDAS